MVYLLKGKTYFESNQWFFFVQFYIFTRNFLKERSPFLRIFHGDIFDGTLEDQEILGIDIDTQLFKILQIGRGTDNVSINSMFCRGAWKKSVEK